MDYDSDILSIEEKIQNDLFLKRRYRNIIDKISGMEIRNQGSKAVIDYLKINDKQLLNNYYDLIEQVIN